MILTPPLIEFDVKLSALTQPFWDAVRAERLIVQRCSACERTFFRPEIACPHCLSTEWRWVDSCGRGSLYSFSVIHRAPTPAFTVPFILAIVDMEEGWTMMSNLVGIEPDAARIGMTLEIVFAHQSDNLHLPLFQPTTETGSSPG